VIDYGWAVALELQDRNEIFRCGFGQTSEAQGCGILRELEFLSGAEDLCGEDFGFDAADREDRGRLEETEPLRCGSMRRPEVRVDVERVAAAGEVIEVAKAYGSAAIGAVDGTAVGLEPRAYGFERLDGSLRNGAVRLGTDVEQIVTALLGACGEVVDDALGRFPFGVVKLKAPAEIHGVAGLPGALGGFDLVLGC